MHELKVSNERVTIELSHDELGILSNALNEVCYGVKLPAFSARIGAERAETEELLDQLSHLYNRTSVNSGDGA